MAAKACKRFHSLTSLWKPFHLDLRNVVMRIRSVLLALASLFLLSVVSFGSDLVLIHARIYTSPTEPPIENGTIVMNNGHITAVKMTSAGKHEQFRKEATVIDCSGRVVTAGFWNSHVHILTPALLNAAKSPSEKLSAQMDEMFTRWGFTTVFDIASVLENTNNIRQRINAGDVRGPRILTVGAPFYPKGGTPIYVKGFLEENHILSAEVDSAAQAAQRARQQIKDGADGVKIFTGAIVAGGVMPMPVDIAKAIVTEAHAAGKPAFAHPSNAEGIDVAIKSGVDILAHTAPMSGDWSPAYVAKLKAAHLSLIPTLTLFDVEAKKANVSAEENEK